MSKYNIIQYKKSGLLITNPEHCEVLIFSNHPKILIDLI